MGAELVRGLSPYEGSESDDGLPSISYAEQFYEQFPFYLSIGMTYNQYWNDDCCLVKYYRKAYELQKDRKNQELWLQGMYIYEAIGDMSPILRPFTKKGTKPVEYVSEPYAISKKEVHDREVQREKAAYDKMKAKANAFAIKFNGELSKKPREEEVSDGK